MLSFDLEFEGIRHEKSLKSHWFRFLKVCGTIEPKVTSSKSLVTLAMIFDGNLQRLWLLFVDEGMQEDALMGF